MANEKLYASINDLKEKDQFGLIGIVYYPETGFLFTIAHLIIASILSFLSGSLIALCINKYIIIILNEYKKYIFFIIFSINLFMF